MRNVKRKNRWVRACTVMLFAGLVCFIAPAHAQTIGHEIPGTETEYSNSDAVSAEERVGDDLSLKDGIIGVYSDHGLDEFENTAAGAISALGQVGNAETTDISVEHVYGVLLDDAVLTFINDGSISAAAETGDVLADGLRAYVEYVAGARFSNAGSFMNTGEISAVATSGDDAAGDWSSRASIQGTRGVFFSGELSDGFTNTGAIIAGATAGDAVEGTSEVYAEGTRGVQFGDDNRLSGFAGDFVNEGTISADAVAGDAAGYGSDASAWSTRGVQFALGNSDAGFDGNFFNTGTISASGITGDAAGERSRVESWGTRGVHFDFRRNDHGFEGDFVNEGSIGADAVAGDAAGEDSLAVVWGTRGTSFTFVGRSGETIDGFAGDFVNTGTISADAVAGDAAGDSSVAYVYGTRAAHFRFEHTNFGLDGDFVNEGTISADAVAGDAAGEDSLAYIYGTRGVRVTGIDGTFRNTGTISAGSVVGDAAGDSSQAYIWATRGLQLDGDFFNTGTIRADAEMGGALGNEAEAFVHATRGIQAADIDGFFSNQGTISATIAAGGAAGDDSELYIEGTRGVQFTGELSGGFVNEGAISTNVTVGTASGDTSEVRVEGTRGVHFGDSVGGDVINTGLISTSVTAGSASGENAQALIDGVLGASLPYGAPSFDNQGVLSATVQAGDGVYIGDVAGLASWDDIAINNSGTISVGIKAGDRSTMQAAGIGVAGGSDVTINNKGDIFLSFDSPYPDSEVAGSGIYLDGVTAAVSNPGTIHLSSNAGVTDVRTLTAMDSTVTLVDGFSAKFGSPGIDNAPIYVDAASSLDLNDANLIARTGSAVLFTTPYRVIENDGGTVIGEFGNLLAGGTNPEITVSWADPDEKGENAAVVFRFTPVGNPAARSVTVGSTVLSQNLSLFSNTLSRPGQATVVTARGSQEPVLYAQAEPEIMSDATVGSPRAYRYENGVFFLPYYSKLNDSGIGADADTFGFFLGYERDLGNGLTAGAFGGLSTSEVDYTGVFHGNTEDQDTYTLGVNLVYDQPRWFADFMATYNWISHDYRGLTGLNNELWEVADYDSAAFVSQLRAGVKLALDNNIAVRPYGGLRWTRWSTDSFRTTVTPATWSTHYDSISENWFKGILGIAADKAWQGAGEGTWRLYGGIGAEHALNNNDVAMVRTLQGVSTTLKEEHSRTSAIGNLGVEYGKGNVTVNLDLSSELNEDYTVYMGTAKLQYRF